MMFLRIYGKIQKGLYPRIQSLMEKGDLHLVSNNTTQHVIGNGQKEVKPFPFDDDIISHYGGGVPEKFFAGQAVAEVCALLPFISIFINRTLNNRNFYFSGIVLADILRYNYFEEILLSIGGILAKISLRVYHIT